MSPPKRVAVIAGAGPAGLTAALELLRRSDILPIVFEADTQVGGISKTINYRGNRMDLGGHRFFSKSDWVMRWWQEICCRSKAINPGIQLRIHYQRQAAEFAPDAPLSLPLPMPSCWCANGCRGSSIAADSSTIRLTLNAETLNNLGLVETFLDRLELRSTRKRCRAVRRTRSKISSSTASATGFIAHFSRIYTEKVWGVPCTRDLRRMGRAAHQGPLGHQGARARARRASSAPARTPRRKPPRPASSSDFSIPNLVPVKCGRKSRATLPRAADEIRLQHRVVGVERTDDKVTAVLVRDEADWFDAAGTLQFLSVNHAGAGLERHAEAHDDRVLRVSQHLPYRDFMTAGLLLGRCTELAAERPRMACRRTIGSTFRNRMCSLGRLQIFNNWSPHLVADPATIWLGLEYFCREGDDLWSMNDGRFVDFAAAELEKIGMIDRRDVLDGTVVRVPKAYPAYFGEYRDFGVVRAFLARFSNLYPIGRNGMHRYNNQDHSMLAADGAVNAILNGGAGKADIWAVNAEESYHEEALPADDVRRVAAGRT